jgi:hypothetical protein
VARSSWSSRSAQWHGQEERCSEVDGEHAILLLGPKVHDRLRHVDPGRVHQHIEPSQLCHGLLHHSLVLGRIGEVGCQWDDPALAGRFRCGCFQIFLASGEERDVGTAATMARAVPRPRPLLAPVMRHTFPARDWWEGGIGCAFGLVIRDRTIPTARRSTPDEPGHEITSGALQRQLPSIVYRFQSGIGKRQSDTTVE